MREVFNWNNCARRARNPRRSQGKKKKETEKAKQSK
jgi:hypothetical protein